MEETIPLKILLIADGRSPITCRWITMLNSLGHHISLVSSYPCQSVDGVENLYVLPLAFSSFGGSQAGSSKPTRSASIITRIRPAAQKMRHWLGPWTLGLKTGELQRIIDERQRNGQHVSVSSVVAEALRQWLKKEERARKRGEKQESLDDRQSSGATPHGD